MPLVESPRKQALRTAMKNPQLQKTILQAASSPMGSTTRTKANNILTSVQTSYLNRGGRVTMPTFNVGQGGPQDNPFAPTATVPNQIILKPLAVNVDLNAPQVSMPLLPENLRPAEQTAVTYVMPFADEFAATTQAPAEPQQPGLWDKTKNMVGGWFGKKPATKSAKDGQGAGLPLNTTYGSSPFGRIQLQPSIPQFDISKLQAGTTAIPQPQSSTIVGSTSQAAGQFGPTSTGLTMGLSPEGKLVQREPITDISRLPQTTTSPVAGLGRTGGLYGAIQSTGAPAAAKSVQPVPQTFLNQSSRLTVQLVNGKLVQTGEMPKTFWKYTDDPTVYDSSGNPLTGSDYQTQSLVGDWTDIFDAGPDPNKRKPTVPTTAAATTQPPPEGAVYGPPKPEGYMPPTPEGALLPGDLGYQQPLATYQPTGNALVDFLNQTYQQGLGRSSFTLGVMADADKMSLLIYGKPSSQLTPEEAAKLPVGASLAGQLNDLENNLRKESHLDEIQNNLMRQVGVGQTLQDDLTAYVRGKDEYLNSVDQMLQKVKDQYWASSMRSDPFYQKSMNQYMDYLTILKGRQTQRYIDFLNTGINYQNAQVGQLQNMYNSLSDQVNRTFQQRAAITTEQYTQIKDILEEMYDNVTQRTALQDENSMAYWELQKARAEAEKAVLDNQYTQLYGPNKKASISASDYEGVLKPQFVDIHNPGEAITDPLLLGEGYSQDSIFSAFQKYRIGQIKEAAAAGNIDSEQAKDNHGIAEFAASMGVDPETDPTVTNYAAIILKAYTQGVEQYINDNYQAVVEVLKSMINKNNRNKFAHWKANNNNQGLTDDITMRLLQLVDNTERSDGTRDLSKLSASEIALGLGALV